MPTLSTERLTRATSLLRLAESKVRILRSIAWSPEVKERFFADGARELPRVSYPSFDAAPVHAQLAEARALIDFEPVIDAWLGRTADAIATSADLLASVEKPAFLEYGARLYGLPTTPHAGGSPIELARTFDRVFAEVSHVDLGAPPAACHLADAVAVRMREACDTLFGTDAPEVLVVDHLSANALAGPRRVQIRRDACFTDRDVEQLVQHEAYVHVCTSLNGGHQDAVPILGASHAGTTRTQEGLAVFAEFITGTLDPDRTRRLADRVLAIQMAIEGADFLQVYRYYRERAASESQAFESTRRVFRGGVLTGGAPFTKDSVYLDGFLRVSDFLRSVVSLGRTDGLQLLFCGKLDVDDIPALARLAELGLCRPPLYLPPWASDHRYLVTFLAYTSFLSSLPPSDHHASDTAMLAHVPVLRGFGRNERGPRAAADDGSDPD
ncbi:hypothetical protein Pla163_00990 [Planctomycetes bacterium Pla163]|uniref:DUF1704 domain-containing protein n=1 Tax=Rohdeia mirabilis TaxID=2528008 RepID=A0A518CUX4_9BACT|nr:hypothetical protein Pla163_00990 [Planctomycetes bacterium Pla163]